MSYALAHTLDSKKQLDGLDPEKRKHAKEALMHLAADPLNMSTPLGAGNIRTCRTNRFGCNFVLAEGMRGLIRNVVILALWDPDAPDEADPRPGTN